MRFNPKAILDPSQVEDFRTPGGRKKPHPRLTFAPVIPHKPHSHRYTRYEDGSVVDNRTGKKIHDPDDD